MKEKYCKVCGILHTSGKTLCCFCDGELEELAEDNRPDLKECGICIDHIEMA